MPCRVERIGRRGGLFEVATGQGTQAARRVVIATGSTPTMLPQLKDVGPGVIVSDNVFEWTDLLACMVTFRLLKALLSHSESKDKDPCRRPQK